MRVMTMFSWSAVCLRAVELAALERAVLAEIERLGRDVTDEEVARVALKSRAAAVFRLSKNLDLAQDLAYCQTVLGNWRFFADYIRDIDRITAADVRETVQQVFRRTNMTVGALNRTAAKGDGQ